MVGANFGVALIVGVCKDARTLEKLAMSIPFEASLIVRCKNSSKPSFSTISLERIPLHNKTSSTFIVGSASSRVS